MEDTQGREVLLRGSSEKLVQNKANTVPLDYVTSIIKIWLHIPSPVLSDRQKMEGPLSQALRVVSRSSPGPGWLLSTTLPLQIFWDAACHSQMTGAHSVGAVCLYHHLCTVNG